MNEIYVYLIDLKTTKVTETITENADGSYTIFINSRFSREQQIEAYNHALEHILRNDFERYDADCIEYECHKASA